MASIHRGGLGKRGAKKERAANFALSKAYPYVVTGEGGVAPYYTQYARRYAAMCGLVLRDATAIQKGARIPPPPSLYAVGRRRGRSA